MSSSSRISLFAVVLVLAVAAMVWWMTTRDRTRAPSPSPVASEQRPTPPVAAPAVAPHATLSTAAPVAVTAPATPSALVAPAAAAKPFVEKAPTAAVKSDAPASSPPPPASPTTTALADAHRTGQHAEQTSPLLAPPPFDADVFAKNPAPYLTQSVPGRVFQTAAPGPGVPVLASQGRATVEMPHGESRDLAVKAPPGSPVTFTTFDLGTFPNGLPSITVVAGPDGIATARYAAAGGVVGDVHILAGSPQASGQVKFHVSVEAPISRAAP